MSAGLAQVIVGVMMDVGAMYRSSLEQDAADAVLGVGRRCALEDLAVWKIGDGVRGLGAAVRETVLAEARVERAVGIQPREDAGTGTCDPAVNPTPMTTI